MKKLILGLGLMGSLGLAACTSGQDEIAAQREDVEEAQQELSEERQDVLDAQSEAAQEEGERAPAAVDGANVDCAMLQEGGISADEQAIWDQHCKNQ